MGVDLLQCEGERVGDEVRARKHTAAQRHLTPLCAMVGLLVIAPIAAKDVFHGGAPLA